MKTLRPLWITVALAAAILCILLTVRREGDPKEVGAEGAGSSREAALAPSEATVVPVMARAAVAEKRASRDCETEITAVLARKWDVTKLEERRALLAELNRLAREKNAETERKARELDLPLMTEAGGVLVGFQGELPLYDVSHNNRAAISTATDLVRETLPYDVDGYGHKIGLWDVAYAPLSLHQELLGNIDIRDNAIPGGWHATHVAGTMIGKGIDSSAQGMAPRAKVWAYSSTDVLTELAAAASTDESDFGKLYVSVHPYGAAAGWENWGNDWYGSFSDDGDRSNDFVPFFGQYSSTTAAWDGLAKNFPYHLMVKSSGNHADDRPPGSSSDNGLEQLLHGLLQEQIQGESEVVAEDEGGWWSLNGTSTWFWSDRSTHPKADPRRSNTSPNGLGTIDPRASAKNVLTVGSVKDAVTSGVRDLNDANLNGFSSAGPTDDGRIKPDVVANGKSLHSADSLSPLSYYSADGTSMAAASAGGSALLLVDLHKDLSGKAMRASSLKGLLIHTADDRGDVGPDYRYGWGLLNIERAAELLVDHDNGVGAGQARFVEESLMSASDVDYYVVDHDGSSPLRVTLCWTDEAGDWTSGHDNRSPRLVNDLNLRVVGSDNTTYYPYVMPFTSTWAEEDLLAPATTGVNTVDNVEQVYLGNLPAGQYTIHIDLAGSLTGGSQDYSLHVSGSHLAGAGVAVANPVADQGYIVLDTSKIDNVADVDNVFTGQDHTYGISWTPAGLLSDATIAGDGKVDLFPTATAYGTVEVTLTAQDASGGFASDTFKVTLRPTQMFVDADTPAAPAEQDGATWATAYRHLQDALAGAVEDQEIWVAAGVYYPDVDNAGDSDARSRSFVTVRKVSMFGGFAGGEATVEERNPALNLTILSGDIHQDDLQQPIATRVDPQSGDENNSCRVVDMSACYGDEVLDGFVVTAGRADSAPSNLVGAGVFSIEDVKIVNCWVTGNYAAGNGAGLYLAGGNPIISSSRINGNEAGVAGAGVYAQAGYPEFFNCELRGNRAADGGGLCLEDADIEMLNCVISGNKALFGGGGIHLGDGKLELVNCTLSANRTLGSGGALYVVNAAEQPKFKNVVIWNNLGGGSSTSAVASVFSQLSEKAPKFYNSLVANSGGSAAWNLLIGSDEGGNVDLDPGFVQPIDPNSTPSLGGDFRLGAGSPALNGGLEYYLLADKADLDGDGDTHEDVEVDLAGNARLVSVEVDMGPYEFGDLTQIDADNDGMSDEFEMAHGGDLVTLDAMSDLDGDGLTALAEFYHGEDPTAPLTRSVVGQGTTEYGGTTYLTATITINPAALTFMRHDVQRRGDLASPAGWEFNKAIEISSAPLPSNPALLEVTYRSLVPFGTERMEFLRVRHEVLGN